MVDLLDIERLPLSLQILVLQLLPLHVQLSECLIPRVLVVE